LSHLRACDDGKATAIESDLRKVDQHVIAPEEYDEAPELTEDMLARAEIREGDKVIRPSPIPAPRRPADSK